MSPRPVIALGLLLAGGWAFSARAAGVETAVDYLREVKPVLTRHCTGCHGAEQTKGSLRLDTARAGAQGGDAGPAWIPGKPDESLLVQLIDGTHPGMDRMPYKREPLDPHDRALLRRWIAEGATAPTNEVLGRHVHWAFVPPQPSPLPQVREARWIRTPIDAFILEALELEGITPSPEADPATLLRRVFLDLTGLPPSPEDLDEFLADPDDEAYARVVDRLLRSPHYGERWARWWLDAARYADSNGYSFDAARSIWPWRDWVINAFNQDLPFAEFITDQIAGDLRPGATLDQRVATGFHRNTQINQEGGIDPEQFRIESVIDRVNTTGTVFLGLTLGCAQCHDHKFDPVSQREYFQMFAFFNDQEEPELALPSPSHAAALRLHEERTRDLEGRLAAATTDEARNALRAELATHRKAAPKADSTLVLTERAQPRESYLFIKGDFTRRGPDVTPATPAVLHPMPRAAATTSPRPTRLDLAAWIASPANPLTSRVLVNRVWQQLFGTGLVATENDFGTQGAAPTHPRLLDWLASEFQSQHGSLKSLNRLLVLSSVYRQASRARPDLAEKDPNNRLLARQNRLRLDAEVIRDVALTASATLEPRIGGPSVFPPQPEGVMNFGQVRKEWKASTGSDRFRRGVYTYLWRATPHPALAVFDAPEGFSSCTRRARSNTPLQALTLLNDPAYAELAELLARRLQREPSDASALRTGFRLCLARSPALEETTRLQQLLDAERLHHGPDVAWRAVARVFLNLDETITRE